MPVTQDLSLSAIGSGVVAAGTFADSAIAPLNNGLRVQRADAALPQTAAGSLFTIAGGPIELKLIYGVVGTVIQTQANNTKLQAKATGQSAVDLCAVLDITAKAAGSIFSITGTAANAMVNGFAVARMTTPWILLPGTIDLNCAASNTGTIRWVAYYVPLEVGATLVAA